MLNSNQRDVRRQWGLGRREFLIASGAALAGFAVWRHRYPESVLVEAASRTPKQVKIVDFTDAGERKGIGVVPVIQKSDSEWKAQLSPASFEVTRQEGTEPPYTGANLNVHDKGVFRCICCETDLFSSDTKFDSGTGWPSFWAPIAKENVIESLDAGPGDDANRRLLPPL
jgi:peptide-methionine (R)-S-oxide reductase